MFFSKTGVFKKPLSPHQTALAMIGAKAGQSVLVVGAGDVDLAAELGLVTGLNGRTVLVDRGPDVAGRVEAAAARAGALVELVDAPIGMLPLDSDTFDVAVVHAELAARDVTTQLAALSEALRAVRPGGRLVVVEGTRRSGLFGALPRRTATLAPEAVFERLRRAGGLAVRTLGTAEGVAYFEARKGAGGAG